MTIEVSQDTASVLSGLSRTLATDRTVDTTLATIVTSAEQLLPRVRAVGISYLAADHQLMARAQSGQLVTVLDDLQTELQEGPCIQVLVHGEDRVRVDDLRTDPRWPAFARHAVRHGIASVSSSRLFIERTTLGVLSLFAEEPGAFDEKTASTGELLAAHAAVALGALRREDQFNAAVRRRDVIGQAKGVLMSRHGVDEDTAFTTLVRLSQSQNLKLHEVAVRLMNSVTVDGGRATRPA